MYEKLNHEEESLWWVKKQLGHGRVNKVNSCWRGSGGPPELGRYVLPGGVYWTNGDMPGEDAPIPSSPSQRKGKEYKYYSNCNRCLKCFVSFNLPQIGEVDR